MKIALELGLVAGAILQGAIATKALYDGVGYVGFIFGLMALVSAVAAFRSALQ